MKLINADGSISYKRGPYQVVIGDNGVIRVKERDWLSKYSAAIYDDFIHIHEFFRKDDNGNSVLIKDYDKVYAGETLYHLPTLVKHNPPVLSDEEKKNIVLNTLKFDFKLTGEKFRLLSKTVDYAGKSLNFTEVSAEVASDVAAIVAEDSFFGLLSAEIASASSFIGALLTPVAGTMEIVQSYDEDIRFYAMRGIAYTITAWAFDDPIPRSSPIILQRYVMGELPHNRIQEQARMEQAWRNTSEVTLAMIRNNMQRHRYKKERYQLILKSVGDGERSKLCKHLLKGFEGYISNVIWKKLWQSDYGVIYPK